MIINDERQAEESPEEGSDGDWTRRTALKALGAATGTAGVLGLSTAEADQATAALSTDSESIDTVQESGGGWSQQAKLADADGDSEDRFGISVALSSDGTTALIGAQADEAPNGENTGSAYVFTRDGGKWRQSAKLAADNGYRPKTFGSSVALSSDGTTALIGAFTDDRKAGSAYVFTGDGGGWSQSTKLTANDGDESDRFGTSVALSSDGTTALVGAWSDEDPNGENAGSAYVFTGNGGEWSQSAKLAADDGDSDDQFGWSVALSSDGTTALIGAFTDDRKAGSAYVFTSDGGGWSQSTKLTANDGDESDRFGISVALSSDGTTALVGAIGERTTYVFTGDGGEWSQSAKPTARGDFFGWSVGLSSDGTTALTGAQFDDDPNGGKAGSAYVFISDGGDWSQSAKLTADDGDSEDWFGSSVALSSDGATALIGASKDEDPNGDDAGSAYVFALGTDSSPAERFDADDDGEIDREELFTAIDAFQNDNLDRTVLFDIIDEFQSDDPRWSNV